MAERGTRKRNSEETREFFRSLELEEWSECEHPEPMEAGGQGTVISVKTSSGQKGVFKHFKDRGPQTAERFARELRIVTDPRNRHPSIVTILAYSHNRRRLWYISELGENFPAYWEGQRKRYEDDPEGLVKLAIDMILKILDGLAPLHDQGVVHRDIKQNNIVIKRGPHGDVCPILIDFGVAYREGEERLTPADDAVGNRRFSPDVMMNRMDAIVPWLDVFQISQLLIWMISERPTKDWIRPLDWRWVNYHKKLPDDLKDSIRALTALCSEEGRSPKDATEFSSLIGELVVFRTEDESTTGINAAQIKKGISRGRSANSIEAVENLRAIHSSYPIARRAYRKLHDELESVYAELLDRSIPVEKDMDQELDTLYEQAKSSPRRNPSIRYCLKIGEQKSHFYIRVVALAYLPSVRSQGDPPLPKSSNIFAFALQRYSKSIPGHRRKKWVTIERTGDWMLRDEQMGHPERTDAKRIGKIIRSWISDEEIWEAIQ